MANKPLFDEIGEAHLPGLAFASKVTINPGKLTVNPTLPEQPS